jgi:hypothetical protein
VPAGWFNVIEPDAAPVPSAVAADVDWVPSVNATVLPLIGLPLAAPGESSLSVAETAAGSE